METSGLRLQIELGVGPYGDAAELDESARQLRRELLKLEVDQVERPAEGAPPAGAKAAEAVLLGTLVVTAAKEAVGAVVHAVADWLTRRPNRSVKLEIAGDSIEVTNPAAADQRLLIEAFLALHTSS
jgi:hypothetical protein